MAKKKWWKDIKNILLIVLLALTIVIILQNSQTCDLKLLFIEIRNIPKFLLIILSVLLGMGIQSLITLKGKGKKK